MLYHRSSLILPFIAGLSLALPGCYAAEFSGLACQSSEECGALICVNGACVEPEPGNVEPIQGADGCCNQLDILFVLDQSIPMELQCFEETFMAAVYGMTALVHETISDNIDSFHIGFTTASIAPGNPPECQQIGSLLRGEPEADCFGDFLHDKPYLTSEDQNDANEFLTSLACLLRVGTVLELPDDEMKQQDDARPIKATIEALAHAANDPGGCNEGFSRPGVPLLVVMMTNSDQTAYLPVPDGEEPADWWQTIHTLKGFNAAEAQKRVGFVLIGAPDIHPDPAVCSVDDEQSRIPTFYGMLNNDLKRRYDICSMMPDDLVIGEKCSPATGDKLENFSDFILPALDDLTCDVCAP